MVSKETPERRLTEYLLARLNRERREILSGYNPPTALQLGDPGSNMLDYISLAFPVIGWGIQGNPVPAGSLSESDNTIRYPGSRIQGKDIIRSANINPNDPLNVVPTGYIQIPGDGEDDEVINENWRPGSSALVLAGGARAATKLLDAIAGKKLEICIQSVSVAPVDDPSPCTIQVIWSADAGGITGSDDITNISYQFDVTTALLCGGCFQVSFPFGKKFSTTVAGKYPTAQISGGNGIETVLIEYLWRAFE